jgi:putative nucleotidyltransferase with HDIG domain
MAKCGQAKKEEASMFYTHSAYKQHQDGRNACSDSTRLPSCEEVCCTVDTIIARCHTRSIHATLLSMLCDQAQAALDVEAALVLLCDPSGEHTLVEESRYSPEYAEKPCIGAIKEQVMATGKPYVHHVPSHVDYPIHSNRDGDLCTIACIPLVAQSSIVGILLLGRDTPISHAETHLLTIFARVAADAVVSYPRQSHATRPADARCETTLLGWLHTLAMRDADTWAHSLRVSEVTVALAREMGIQGKDLEHIHRGALLHDIGKLVVPASVIQKSGPLDEEEWKQMRQHPTYAQQILSSYVCFRHATAIPHFHHEKWDGSGYPHGLRGDAIPLAARMAAVVDVWDALRSDRPHRSAWSEDHIRAYLLEKSGTHFDPYVVAVFLGWLAEQDTLSTTLNQLADTYEQPDEAMKVAYGHTARCSCQERYRNTCMV